MLEVVVYENNSYYKEYLESYYHKASREDVDVFVVLNTQWIDTNRLPLIGVLIPHILKWFLLDWTLCSALMEAIGILCYIGENIIQTR